MFMVECYMLSFLRMRRGNMCYVKAGKEEIFCVSPFLGGDNSLVPSAKKVSCSMCPLDV